MRCTTPHCIYESPYFDAERPQEMGRFLIQKGLLQPNRTTHCPICAKDSLEKACAVQLSLLEWEEEITEKK